MSYALVKRGDLLAALDLVMAEHLPKLLNQSESKLIQSRICLFLGFYMDQLFSTQPRTIQSDYFSKILDFLFKALALPKPFKIVSLQALDALTTQLSETALSQQIEVNFDSLI